MASPPPRKRTCATPPHPTADYVKSPTVHPLLTSRQPSSPACACGLTATGGGCLQPQQHMCQLQLMSDVS
jgi:hypothetical protein